jgi:hypothetical protein
MIASIEIRPDYLSIGPYVPVVPGLSPPAERAGVGRDGVLL